MKMRAAIFILAIWKIAIAEDLCPDFPGRGPKHGYLSRLKKNSIYVFCDAGYVLYPDSQEIICRNGQWDLETEYTCEEPENRCKKLNDIENGELLISGMNWRVGSWVTYRCKHGYDLVNGDKTRTCTKNRHWSGVEPFCQLRTTVVDKLADMFIKQNKLNTAWESNDTKEELVASGFFLGPDIFVRGLDLVILVDKSESLEEKHLTNGLSFVKKLIKTFGVSNDEQDKTRVAVVAFGNKAELIFNLDDAKVINSEVAEKLLDGITAYGGGTNLEAAFVTVIDSILPLIRKKAKKALFLLTDGTPTKGHSGVEPEDYANQLKQPKNGFEIFVVGVGKDINKKKLDAFGSLPSYQHSFNLHEFEDFEKILDLIQTDPSTTKPPPLPKPGACGYLSKREDENRIPHPWLVSIVIHTKTKSVQFCTGVLICEKWVLTNAGCVTEANGAIVNGIQIDVKLGDDDIDITDKNEKSYYVESVKISAKHDVNHPNHYRLALLKLYKSVPLGETYMPICFKFFEGIQTPLHHIFKLEPLVEGWGVTPSITGHTTMTLSADYVNIRVKRNKMNFLEEVACTKYLNNTLGIGRKVHVYIVCAGTRSSIEENIQDSCSGNFGSPLVAKNKKSGRYELLGIQATKFGCENYQSVYVLPSLYKFWLSRETKDCWKKHI